MAASGTMAPHVIPRSSGPGPPALVSDDTLTVPSRESASSGISHDQSGVLHSPSATNTHWSLQRERTVPPGPHATSIVVPASQTPRSPVHSEYSHVIADVQKRVCVPHIPHVSISDAPRVVHGSPEGPASSMTLVASGIAVEPPHAAMNNPTAEETVLFHPERITTSGRRVSRGIGRGNET